MRVPGEPAGGTHVLFEQVSKSQVAAVVFASFALLTDAWMRIMNIVGRQACAIPFVTGREPAPEQVCECCDEI